MSEVSLSYKSVMELLEYLLIAKLKGKLHLWAEADVWFVWVWGLMSPFSLWILITIEKETFLHFRLHLTHSSFYLQLSMSQEQHTAALHHFPSFHVAGKLAVAASAGSSVTRLTPGFPEETQNMHDLSAKQ